MPFLFRLETTDGEPAEPPTLASAVPNWRAGDTISLGRGTLRVVRVRDDDADQRRPWSLRTFPRAFRSAEIDLGDLAGLISIHSRPHVRTDTLSQQYESRVVFLPST
jgi:hypothetical protein